MRLFDRGFNMRLVRIHGVDNLSIDEVDTTVFAVGPKVRGITVGQRVLLNPAGAMDNVMGNGGTEGAFGDLLLIRGAKLGEHVLPIPEGLSMTQAALAEPTSGKGLAAESFIASTSFFRAK
jgi:threonine dehydrogenase-like Zn-dependent dehydrogenase